MAETAVVAADVAGEAVIAAAEAAVTDRRLTEICSAIVDIASPTGEEAELARALAAEMTRAGLCGAVQAVDATMHNAHGRLAGHADGPSLLLYSPIDTVTVGRQADDIPWAGPELRPDMRPESRIVGPAVLGLGAQNPKGHAACVLAAAEALAGCGARLSGDLLVGFGAGGMPTNSRASGLADGHGAGCDRLIDLCEPTHAVIAKTGWAVSAAEVGLCWFEVEVSGTHTYVGSRHLLPYRNAVADAGRIIAGLEAWFPTWTEAHRDHLHAPQGVVASIEGGSPHTAAFTTASCRFRVDLRLHPRTTVGEAETAFGNQLQRLADEIGAEVSWRRTVAIPGTTTRSDAAVIRSAIRCWEQLNGRTHQTIGGLSGATDANILRARGVPTARVGLPKISPQRLATHDVIDFQLGMNAVDVRDMQRLTRLLIRVAVDICGTAQ